VVRENPKRTKRSLKDPVNSISLLAADDNGMVVRFCRVLSVAAIISRLLIRTSVKTVEHLQPWRSLMSSQIRLFFSAYS